jgi:hypothetical protein
MARVANGLQMDTDTMGVHDNSYLLSGMSRLCVVPW